MSERTLSGNIYERFITRSPKERFISRNWKMIVYKINKFPLLNET